MKKFLMISMILATAFFAVSCGNDEGEEAAAGKSCTSNEDCDEGQTCDTEKNECVGKNSPDKGSNTGDNGDSGSNGGNGDNGGNNGNGGDNGDSDSGSSSIVVVCTPGDTQPCYEGPSGTQDVGICKAGIATCVEDGTDWSECVGQVLPKAEICGNGIDENCDDHDETPETAQDLDGDGFTYCTGDCCETGWECRGKDPARVSPVSFEIPGNLVDDNCDGHVDEEVESVCDNGINPETTNPLDMAASMDLCPVQITTYGVISAKLLFPDGTGSVEDIQKAQYGVLSAYGNNLQPRAGMTLLAFSNGDLSSTSTSNLFETSSEPPQDWFQANGNKFPNSSLCTGANSAGEPPVNDPIMLELEIRAPNNAEAFSLDVYYISAEFPQYVCKFNDFFVMLLDSSFTTDNPELQNPKDKNIAMDSLGNPLGINLAKSGLFTVCCPRDNYPSCQGDNDLKGTPFTTKNCNILEMTENHGGTGWLTVRGNIVPKEDFKLRLALWDTNDHQLDSMVLLDNFTWYESAGKAGIVPK